MSSYIVNLPNELLISSIKSIDNGRVSANKLEKDSFFRIGVILLYTALEAAINTKLQSSEIEKIPLELKLKYFLCSINNFQGRGSEFWQIFDGPPNSLTKVRNNIIHFKGDYEIYNIIELNIVKYLQFVIEIFKFIYTEETVQFWLKTQNIKLDMILKKK